MRTMLFRGTELQVKKIVIRHYQCKGGEWSISGRVRNPRAWTEASVTVHEADRVYTYPGMALCRRSDVFHKKIGAAIAIGRALKHAAAKAIRFDGAKASS